MCGCGVGVVAVAWRGVGGCPAITFGRGAGVRIWVRSVIISLFCGNFAFFSVLVGSDHVWMLSRGALRCVVPACSVGMVAVVCGAVTWTAGNGFSENAKNANSGCFVFAFFR